jgi:Phage integrase, N-terminal SAM-like domain
MTRAGNWPDGLRWIARRVKPSRRHLKNLTDYEKKTGRRRIGLRVPWSRPWRGLAWQPAGWNRPTRTGRLPRDRPRPHPAGFFTDRLARQKKASPNTAAAYRDTCRLLLSFARERIRKAPSGLSLADLDATLVGAFLQHLEHDRGNGSGTRNSRLAAIHSLSTYAAPWAPEHAAVISQVLAIPPRR